MIVAALLALAGVTITALGGVIGAWLQARGAREAAEANAKQIGQTNGHGSVADMLALVISMQEAQAERLDELQREQRVIYTSVRSCPFYSDHQFPGGF